jgi:hypothetical protein
MGVGQVKHTWRTSKGEDRYRRGLYTFTFRASLHPSLATFDAPDAITACTRRIRSNTPLQALNLLNDSAWMEFSRSLAQRVLNADGLSDEQRIAMAFRLATSRQPQPDELQLLAGLLKQMREDYRSDAKDAKAVAGAESSEGEKAGDVAAWTLVARAILNLDETITRE